MNIKKKKILEICRKIEENDPAILNEMAEIILTAREKNKGD